MHEMTLGELTERLSQAHPSNAARTRLWSRFTTLLGLLQGTGIPFSVWVAGSFTTEKPDPSDVDAAFSAPSALLNALAQPHMQTLNGIFLPQYHQVTKIRYSTDAYFFNPDDDAQATYWLGKFGFTRERKAKGIAAFLLQPSTLT